MGHRKFRRLTENWDPERLARVESALQRLRHNLDQNESALEELQEKIKHDNEGKGAEQPEGRRPEAVPNVQPKD